jgi:hypothetical protein
MSIADPENFFRNGPKWVKVVGVMSLKLNDDF